MGKRFIEFPMFKVLAEQTTDTVTALMVSDDRATAVVTSMVPDYKGTAAGRQLGDDLGNLFMGSLFGGQKSPAAMAGEIGAMVGRFKESARLEQPTMREVTTKCTLRAEGGTWRVGLDCGPEWLGGWKVGPRER
jgi:hypothetical protein